MICKVCGAPFSNQLSFKTMYHIQHLCHDCILKYHPLYAYEVIPIDLGVIEYESVYDFDESDPRKKRFLYRYMKKYFQDFKLYQMSDYLILFIDDAEYVNFLDWFPAIKAFKSFKFYSLFYYDWSFYEDSLLFL